MFIFARGNNWCNFLFASVDEVALPKWGLSVPDKQR